MSWAHLEETQYVPRLNRPIVRRTLCVRLAGRPLSSDAPGAAPSQGGTETDSNGITPREAIRLIGLRVFFLVILAHLAVALFHTILLRGDVLSRMAIWPTGRTRSREGQA